ncbi:hypothetical protein Q9R29_12140 [Rothia sp. ARF10]|nr:hypothetical protein [Rothia sp. ARF10]
MPPRAARSGGDVLAAYREAFDATRPGLVVAHSNAGLVAPAVAGGTPLVFVDAALPPASGESPMAPPAMLGHLDALVGDDGLLPPWTRWWGEDDVAPLFPDRSARAGVEASEPRLPLGYFRTTVPVPEGWQSGPCAYLAFGGTYAVELARARRLAWPVAQLQGALHLHFLHDADGVVARVLELASALDGHDAGASGPV